MARVVKTTYTFVILHMEDEPLEGIDHAMREAYDGNAVGMELDSQTVPVPDNQVPAELQKLGNDGSFFEEELSL